MELLLFKSYKESRQMESQTNSFEMLNSKKEKLKIKYIIFPASSANIILSIEE